MPSINIHAHCADHESVQSLLESVASDATWYSYNVVADAPEGVFDIDFNVDETPEAQLGRMVREGECMAGPDCLDPFCDTHYSAGRRIQNHREVGHVSETIFHAGKALVSECHIDADVVERELQRLCTAVYTEESLDRWSSENHAAPWWLIVIWAMQDWKARGIDFTVAESMLRGITADFKGALL